VHRLSGLKVLRLMRRSGAQVAELDKSFMSATDSHTSITAGFALGDGHTVVARLPQAEVELDATTTPQAPTDTPREPATELTALTVVGRNGQPFAARYIGLDGSTGLSLLQVDGFTLPSLREANEDQLRTGQRVRLLAPEPAGRAAEGASAGTLYLHLGETEGQVAEITRAPSGKLVRLSVRASHLSPSIVGGLVLNDAGEIIGIIEASSAGEARITPSAIARNAAERVLAHHGSVPRPWLGVRGKELSSTSLTQLVSGGWEKARAAALLNKGQGILLTSVAPGAPADAAGLRAGDVITHLNDSEIKGAQDLSLLLDEAGSGATIRLTMLRPTSDAPRTVAIRLDETLSPAVATEMAEARAGHTQVADPFIARGAETIQLSQKAAANLGAEGGRLVVFVQPESAASRSGLHAGDLIESVDGQLLSGAGVRLSSALNGPSTLMLGVVREGQKLKIALPK
jgi:serine protease Do